MKEEEEEANNIDASACLSSETQAFEIEFIKTYERLSVLWDVKHPDYTNKYKRGVANDTLLKIMKKWDNNATRATVRQKINVLRSCYRKDLRKHLKSKTIGPDGEETYEYNPKNWKFYALRFLGGKEDEEVDHIKNNGIIEINLDNTNFEEDTSEQEDETSGNASDTLQTKDKIYDKSHTFDERNKKKRRQHEVQAYYVDNTMLDREFEAIGSNVACKLKRMNAEQRCHAELLINKVLIGGLKNTLTDDTDLTEVYK